MVEQLGENPFGETTLNPREQNTKNGERGVMVSLMCTVRMARMSAKANSLLTYILNNMRNLDGVIQIDREKYMKEQEILSKATVVNAINELIKEHIIAKSCKQSWYWVNPNMITLVI